MELFYFRTKLHNEFLAVLLILLCFISNIRKKGHHGYAITTSIDVALLSLLVIQISFNTVMYFSQCFLTFLNPKKTLWFLKFLGVTEIWHWEKWVNQVLALYTLNMKKPSCFEQFRNQHHLRLYNQMFQRLHLSWKPLKVTPFSL